MKKGKVHSYSNRLLYTLIAFGILMILGVGVYATVPNAGRTVGHAANDTEFCGPSQALVMNSAGTGWTCASTSFSSQWIVSEGNIYYNTGNVGIGTATPIAKVYVAGGSITPVGNASQADYAFGADSIASGSSIYAYGPICAGNTHGDCTGTGGTVITASSVTSPAFYYSSDKSLKTNIQALPNALEKLQQLNGISFNWKSDGKPSIGLIAQDVEKVYPEVVSTDSKGIKSVDYAKLVSVLIEAVKQQQKEIDGLKAKLG